MLDSFFQLSLQAAAGHCLSSTLLHQRSISRQASTNSQITEQRVLPGLAASWFGRAGAPPRTPSELFATPEAKQEWMQLEHEHVPNLVVKPLH